MSQAFATGISLFEQDAHANANAQTEKSPWQPCTALKTDVLLNFNEVTIVSF